MSHPYLTEEEIAHITEPLTQGAARIRFFRSMGVTADKKPNGQPLVWRSEFEAVRQRAPAANDARPAALDWTAFNKRVRYGRGPEKKRRQSARA